MKKKILAIVICIAMMAIAVVGGSMAYFTDTDAAQNVMTTGKVDIIQLEQQRDADGNLVDFVQDKPLMPAVYASEINRDNIVQNGYFNPDVRNAVDKIITVKNDAAANTVNQDVYARTIIAFETGTEYREGTSEVLRDGKTIFTTYIGTLGSFRLLERDPVTVDGVQYVLAVKVYDEALVPQQVSTPSLKQIFLSKDAGNEVALLFGSEYTILALSQGTQTAGFEAETDADGNVTKSAAAVALDTAFGALDGDDMVDDATLIGWLSNIANG